MERYGYRIAEIGHEQSILYLNPFDWMNEQITTFIPNTKGITVSLIYWNVS
jgi:hypothetical protein